MPALDISIAEARALYEVNFFSVLRLTQLLAPLLISTSATLAYLNPSSPQAKSPSTHPSTQIINIGSITSVVPYIFGTVYNSSKAALMAYSNTLRLEIAPFGVGVLHVITGGVKSNIAVFRSAASSSELAPPVLVPEKLRSLPAGSMYQAIAGHYINRQNHSQEGAMDTTAYAKLVVAETLRSTPKKEVWWGNKSAFVWYVWTFLGRRALDRNMWKTFGLDVLARIVLVARGN